MYIILHSIAKARSYVPSLVLDCTTKSSVSSFILSILSLCPMPSHRIASHRIASGHRTWGTVTRIVRLLERDRYRQSPETGTVPTLSSPSPTTLTCFSIISCQHHSRTHYPLLPQLLYSQYQHKNWEYRNRIVSMRHILLVPFQRNRPTTNSIILGVFPSEIGTRQYSTLLLNNSMQLFHSCSWHDMTWRDVTWRDVTWRNKFGHSRLLLLMLMLLLPILHIVAWFPSTKQQSFQFIRHIQKDSLYIDYCAIIIPLSQYQVFLIHMYVGHSHSNIRSLTATATVRQRSKTRKRIYITTDTPSSSSSRYSLLPLMMDLVVYTVREGVWYQYYSFLLFLL